MLVLNLLYLCFFLSLALLVVVKSWKALSHLSLIGVSCVVAVLLLVEMAYYLIIQGHLTLNQMLLNAVGHTIFFYTLGYVVEEIVLWQLDK